MPTLATDINRVRTFLRDWPPLDALAASTSSTSTTITVADASNAVYTPNG